MAQVTRTRKRASWQQHLIYAWWAVILTSGHWLLAGWGLAPAAKLPSALLGASILAVAMTRIPTQLALPMGAWVGASALSTFFAVNRIYAFAYFKPVLFLYLLVVCTIALVRSAQHTIPLLRVLFIGQFLWVGAFGVRRGLVAWHPDLANADGFGPIMVIGLGMAFFYGMAVRGRRERLLSFAIAVLCLAGVVSSFARGAVLSLVAVVVYIWWEMPNKKRSTVALLVGGLVVMIAASFLSSAQRGGNTSSPVGFWAEMLTIGDEGDGTTSDRKILWGAATRVFFVDPVIGAGPANFGVVASTLFAPGEIGGEYALNPMRLYDRALHSSYLQILSEQGILGSVVFLWMLFDFVWRNRRLRNRSVREAWAREGPAMPDLRYLALGLEAGLLGFLTTALFYNQLYVHWIYTIIGGNLLLWTIATRVERQWSGVGGRATMRA